MSIIAKRNVCVAWVVVSGSVLIAGCQAEEAMERATKAGMRNEHLTEDVTHYLETHRTR